MGAGPRDLPPLHRPARMGRRVRDRGLSLVFLSMFVLAWAGQALAGHATQNEERRQHGEPEQSLWRYLTSSHFLEATSENWESEFLQMAALVFLTARFFQRGSGESKNPDQPEEPSSRRPASRAPWPVRRGGLALKLYEHSLSLVLFSVFVAAFVLHLVSGARTYSEDQVAHGEPRVTALQYLGNSRFWFESLQNWQSEFLSVLAMVVLSIYLREKGSAESKPVDASNADTGR